MSYAAPVEGAAEAFFCRRIFDEHAECFEASLICLLSSENLTMQYKIAEISSSELVPKRLVSSLDHIVEVIRRSMS